MTEILIPTKPTAPKSDLSDLMALFGRFFSSVLLMNLTIVMLFKHIYAVAALASLAAFLTQRAAIKLYRRLRDERAAALEAMQTPTEEPFHAA